MRTRLSIAMLASLILLLAGGCNIFDWTSGESTQSLIDEGQQHMRDGDYAGAEAKFAQAIEQDPGNADARYYHAKAVMHGSGFNILRLADEVEGYSNPFDTPALLFADWAADSANTLYQAVRAVYDDLSPIHEGQTSGSFGPKDIEQDLLVISIIRWHLMFRDLDSNGIIEQDETPVEIHWGNGIENFHDVVMSRINAGAPKDPGRFSAAQPIPPAIVAALNDLIDGIAEIVALAHDIVVSIGTDFLGYSEEEVESFLAELVIVAPQYRIDDGIDNDHDGTVDEEVVDGIDNDGDGRYDEDSNGQYEF